MSKLVYIHSDNVQNMLKRINEIGLKGKYSKINSSIILDKIFIRNIEYENVELKEYKTYCISKDNDKFTLLPHLPYNASENIIDKDDNFVEEVIDNDRFVSIMFDLSAMVISAALLYMVYKYII